MKAYVLPLYVRTNPYRGIRTSYTPYTLYEPYVSYTFVHFVHLERGTREGSAMVTTSAALKGT